MGLQMRWVGEEEAERVAEARLLCYGHARSDLADLRKRVHTQGRAGPGDFLLAERDGRIVGTATSLRLTMWIGRAPVSCQGVAWVGTVKTERRRSRGDEPGVATAIMREVLRIGHARGHLVSALMPFRASFYDHFGYGNVERRAEWTVPLTILPTGDSSSIRFMEDGDREAMCACYQRAVEHGQCEIERPASFWERYWERTEGGMVVVDRPDENGPIRGWMFFQHQVVSGRDIVRVVENLFNGTDALRRQLHFLAALRDQYWGMTMVLPVDLPLNLLLRETQVPHRPVTHPVAEVKVQTRTQVRILDHIGFVNALRVPHEYLGRAVIEVREAEGHSSRFEVRVKDERIEARWTSDAPDVEMSDSTWASIACGELPIMTAGRLGLVKESNLATPGVLRAFGEWHLPFCRDAF